MQTKPKSNSVVTHSLNGETGVITFHVAGAGDIVLDPSQLHADVQRRAMLHGLVQRIADRAAISRNTANGQPATPADKHAAMLALATHYMTGTAEWVMTREGGAGPGLDGVVLAAVAEATGKDLPTVRELVAKQSAAKGVTAKAYLAALATSDLVAPIVARIRGQQAGVSGNDLLDEMNAAD